MTCTGMRWVAELANKNRTSATEDAGRYASTAKCEARMKWSLLMFAFLLSLVGCSGKSESVDVLMSQNEQGIHRWFDDWMKATKEGDLELARTLIADDAVFLVPGAGLMDKEKAGSSFETPTQWCRLSRSHDEYQLHAPELPDTRFFILHQWPQPGDAGCYWASPMA